MDDDLRALEQRLRAAPTPALRVALARALERVGRRDDAHVVLAADPFAADVRAELARYPAWAHPDGDPGRTSWLDVAPIERAPEVRWRVATGWNAIDTLLATPWGIVHSGARPHVADDALIVLDPETGAVRQERVETSDPLGVIDGALVHAPYVDAAEADGVARALALLDLATGRERWRRPIARSGPSGVGHGWLVVGASREFERLHVLAMTGTTEPPLAGTWAECWLDALTRRRAYVRWTGRAPDFRVHRGVVVLDGEPSPWIEAPIVPWSTPTGPAVGHVAADERGALVLSGRELVLCDPDGRPLWRANDAAVSVLGPTFVVVHGEHGARALDRAGGEPLALALPGDPVTLAAARDWVYSAEAGGTVRGARVNGDDAWSLALDSHLALEDRLKEVVVAGPRRLLVMSHAGVLVCLEQR